MNPRPDGLFVTNDLSAFIHRELINQGIIPQKDIQLVIGTDDFYLNPQPASIHIFDQQIGKHAVQALLWRIKTPDMPQITCSLKPKLLIP